MMKITTTIATDAQVEEMLQELSNPGGQYETFDYGQTHMDRIAFERQFMSFTHRVVKMGWVEMGNEYSMLGYYGLQ